MRKLITYVPAECARDGRAFAYDEDGDCVTVEWGIFIGPDHAWRELPDTIEEMSRQDCPHDNYVRVDGEICLASDIVFGLGSIEFRIEPAGPGVVEYSGPYVAWGTV